MSSVVEVYSGDSERKGSLFLDGISMEGMLAIVKRYEGSIIILPKSIAAHLAFELGATGRNELLARDWVPYISDWAKRLEFLRLWIHARTVTKSWCPPPMGKFEPYLGRWVHVERTFGGNIEEFLPYCLAGGARLLPSTLSLIRGWSNERNASVQVRVRVSRMVEDMGTCTLWYTHNEGEISLGCNSYRNYRSSAHALFALLVELRSTDDISHLAERAGKILGPYASGLSTQELLSEYNILLTRRGVSRLAFDENYTTANGRYAKELQFFYPYREVAKMARALNIDMLVFSDEPGPTCPIPAILDARAPADSLDYISLA